MILQMLSEKTPARVMEMGCGVWGRVRGSLLQQVLLLSFYQNSSPSQPNPVRVTKNIQATTNYG